MSPPTVVNGKRLNITYKARSSVGEGRCKEPKMVQSGDIRPLERKKTVVHRKHGGDRYVSRKIIFSDERRLKNGITSNLQGCQTILDEATPYFDEVESMTKNGPIIVMENSGKIIIVDHVMNLQPQRNQTKRKKKKVLYI